MSMNSCEFGRRADAAYDRFVAPDLTSADANEFVALDVLGGEYEIDANELTAIDRLESRKPEVTIPLTVRGPRGRERKVTLVVDTRFTGLRMLPPGLVEELDLRRRGTQRGALANGSGVELQVYEAAGVWNDQRRRARVLAAGGDPSVGIELLRGHELSVQAVAGCGDAAISRHRGASAAVAMPINRTICGD
jgi:predicted aspartyl protease